jgi:hypothetical protein
MGKYCLVKRALRGLEGVFGSHVGVLNKKTGKILELYVEKNGDIIIHVNANEEEFSDGKKVFREDVSDQTMDFSIQSRWKQAKRLYENGELKKIGYDASGQNGVSCETIAYWILTGKARSPQGDRLKILNILNGKSSRS